MLYAVVGIPFFAVGLIAMFFAKRRQLARTNQYGVQMFSGAGHYFGARLVDAILRLAGVGGLLVGGVMISAGMLVGVR